MKLHIHSEQFDGRKHAWCGRTNDEANVLFEKEFEAAPRDRRCKLCERDHFPYGQPDWHHKQSERNLMNTTTFKFGTATVPDGVRGPWRISTFTLTEDDVLMANLRHIRDGNAYMVCPAGTYRRLSHKERGCIMSNTPMEINTAQEAIRDATGRVLVAGLGLGMVVEALLHKPEVEHVTVVELDKHVIQLVAPHMHAVAHYVSRATKLFITQGDITRWTPPEGVKYDYAWHDIWDQIDDDNLPQMNELVRRFRPFAKKQGVWSRDQARRIRDKLRREDRSWVRAVMG